MVSPTQPTNTSAVFAALNGGAAATAATAPTSSAAAEQNQFMTLLVTQLKNQDPLNPMDNAQLTSQIAQINTVGGINQRGIQLVNTTHRIYLRYLRS